MCFTHIISFNQHNSMRLNHSYLYFTDEKIEDRETGGSPCLKFTHVVLGRERIPANAWASGTVLLSLSVVTGSL